MFQRLTLLLLLSPALIASAGTLTTRDGKTYTGSLQFRDTSITVDTDDGAKSVPLADVRKADFRTGFPAPKAGHGLLGEYFLGRDLKKLLLTRVDPVIDYDWKQTFPHPSLASTGREFSVRWSARLRPDRSDKYTLVANTDDGVRVYLGGKLVIDQWHDQAATDNTAEVQLEKDHAYDLRVEYYNGNNDASASLAWFSPSTPRQIIPSANLYLPQAATAPTTAPQTIRIKTPSSDGGPAFERILQPDRFGLKAEYFADRDLTTLNFIRFDPNIDFHFHPDNPPDPAMSPEGSIRWTGMLEPRYTDDYRIHAEVRRRIRVWVADKLVIDQWKGEGSDEYSSDKIPLVAGKKVPFKVEYTSPNGYMLCRLRWSSKSQPRDTIPPGAFTVAPDEKLGRPVVGMVYPATDSFVASPASLAVLATALTPNGRIQKLQFYNGNSPIADLNAQPFRFVWDKPQPGVYALRAKVTDSSGVTAMSDVENLTITGRGDGTLQAPWGDFYIANNDSRNPGTASQKGDAFTIDNAVGTLVSESEHDAGHFVIQPLDGDGQIIARVSSVRPGPDDGVAGAMAGVTIRESLKNRCKEFSMLYGQAGEEPAAQFVRRPDHWMNPVVTEKSTKAPVWVKLARYGQRVYAYTSADGKDWDLFASERFEAASRVFAGLVAYSPSSSRPATAEFDHVKLVPGAPALESAAKGFLTRGGTFVACDVYAIDDNLVRYVRNGAQGSIRVSEVARILYKPLLLDHAEKLSPGGTGLLMSTGDFLDGDIKSLKDGTVTVSSVLFGPRKVAIYDELTAIVLHDVSAEKTAFTVTTTDGSTYRPKTLKPTLQTLQIEDASLGQLSIPLGTLSQLQAQ